MQLDLPDNITTSPRGTLVVCEDNTDNNYLRGLSKNGKLWDIALNPTNDEFAGSTFSPDGRDAVRQHPVQSRKDVRDLGAVAQHRRLRNRGVRDGQIR